MKVIAPVILIAFIRNTYTLSIGKIVINIIF